MHIEPNIMKYTVFIHNAKNSIFPVNCNEYTTMHQYKLNNKMNVTNSMKLQIKVIVKTYNRMFTIFFRRTLITKSKFLAVKVFNSKKH